MKQSDIKTIFQRQNIVFLFLTILQPGYQTIKEPLEKSSLLGLLFQVTKYQVVCLSLKVPKPELLWSRGGCG